MNSDDNCKNKRGCQLPQRFKKERNIDFKIGTVLQYDNRTATGFQFGALLLCYIL